LNSATKLGISAIIIVAVILSSSSNINWESLVGISNRSNEHSNQHTASDNISLNVAYFPNLNHASAIIGFQNGNFKNILDSANNSKNISINERVFSSSPAVIEALYAGQIDVAYVNPNSIIDGYILAGSDGFKIISGVSSGGASFIVRNDSGIESPSDLGGKKFASPQLGNTQDVALRKYLQDNGFKTTENGGNVTILPIANADILTVFLKGDIDGAWVPEPWSTRLVQEADGKVLLDERDLWPDGKFVTGNIIVRTDYLEQNPDVIKKLLEAHVEETLKINNDTKAAATEFNTQLKKITGQEINPAVLDESYSHLEITYDPLKLTLFKSANDAYDLGFIEKGKDRPNLSGIYDTTILDEVLTEKGLQPIGNTAGSVSLTQTNSSNTPNTSSAVADIVI
jgi:NitT/TauT family transport system substrate-binding protein